MSHINKPLTRRKSRWLSLCLAAVIILAALPLYPIPANADTVTGNIETGWGPIAAAVNPATNKIYVANVNNDSITVINGANNSATTVTVGLGPLAIAANPATNKIYVANQDNTVTVIDGVTDSAINAVTVGTKPCAIAVNTVTNKIYVTNQHDSTVTVIDGTDDSVSETVAAGTGPGAIAINPTTNKIYVANNGSNDVTVINGADNSATTVTAGTTPWAIAVNPATNKIYVANNGSSNVTVINGVDNSTTTVKAGKEPCAVAVNPATNKIYVANFVSPSLTVIDGANNTATTLAAGAGPWAVAVNPATNKIYVANNNSSGYDVKVINGADNSIKTLAAGSGPNAVAINTVTNKIYIVNNSSKNVTVIDGADNSTTTVAAGASPCAIAVNPITNRIYIANYSNGNVTVIDGADNSTATVKAGSSPIAVAVNPATNKIYVANLNSANVTVINGADNSTTKVELGTIPCSIAVNPVTNKIYVANLNSANVTVINGADNSTTTVEVGTTPNSVAVNTATNKIYVANYDSPNVTVINGDDNSTTTVTTEYKYPFAVAVNTATNKIYVANKLSADVTVINGDDNSATTVTAGSNPFAVAVNPATNKIYVANFYSNNVTVINGNDNSTTTVETGTNPCAVAVNPATNKIYVNNRDSDNVTVIDGINNSVSTVATCVSPMGVTVNPINNKVYVTNFGSANVTVIDEQAVQEIDPGVVISALPGDITTNPTPDFNFSATTSSPLPVRQIWYQVDSTTGAWQKALPEGNSAGVTLPLLSLGTHVLYAMATDGQDSTCINTGAGSSPLIGKISSYAFSVILSGENNILTFTLPQQTGAAAIDSVAHTVYNEVSLGTSLASLTPDITVSQGATINPASGAAQDFSAPVTYTVTAENGIPQDWTVTVTVASSSANNILTFTLPQQTGAAVIDSVAHTVYNEVSCGTSLASLTPTITVSSGAAVNPASGAAQNFSAPVTYTVTAEDGTPQDWTVTVTVAASNNADLSGLNLSHGTLSPAFAADITSYTASVANEVASINVTAVTADSTASMKINGNPAVSGTAFPVSLAVGSNPITIKITAPDTTTKTYNLTVTRAPSSPSPGRGGSNGSSADDSVWQVGRDGRTIQPDGITIIFPSGAVENDIYVTLKKSAQNQGFNIPDGSLLLSRVWNIIKDKSGSFLKPVTITLSFDKSRINPDEYDIAICYYDEAAASWAALDNIKLDLTAGKANGDVLHFTKFAVIASPKTKLEKPPVTPPPAKNIPGDIKGHWAQDSIIKLIDAEIMAGYPDGTFKPDRAITRAEFTVMIVKALNLPHKEGKTFSDTASHWAKDNISTASAHGIISGFGPNTFGPDALITREQAAVIIARAAKLEIAADGLNFTDSSAISPWAQPGIAAAVKNAFIGGYPDNSFRPQGNTTRAEAATMILKLLQAWK